MGGGGSVGRSGRCGDARGEALAARNGSNARGATGEGECGGDTGGCGCTAEDKIRRGGKCDREGSSPSRIAPSGPPCVGWAGLWVRCSVTEEKLERKLASSPEPVREVDEEATELRSEVVTPPIGKEAGKAPLSASTAAVFG